MYKTDNIINEVTEEYRTLMPKIIKDAEDIAAECEDYYVKTLKNKMIFTSSESIDFEQESIIEPEVSLNPTEYAFEQLCSKVGFPVNLYKKQKQIHENQLANKNINTHMAHYSGKLMIRTYKNIIRGILSERYTSFDADKIVKMLADAIEANTVVPVSELGINGYINNYERLHIRLINKTPLNINGQTVYAGLTINTSDVGMAKISVKFYLYNSLSSNGVCIDKFRTELFEEKHIHISEKEIKDRLAQAFKNFPGIMNNAKIYIQNAENFELTNSMLFDEESSLNKMLRKFFNLNQKDIKGIIQIAENNPKNLWGYVSSFSEYAKTQSFEKRLEMERSAGKLLLYPDKFGIMAG